MTNKPKQQGTAWEREVLDLITTTLQHDHPNTKPIRLAEHGSLDTGDIGFHLGWEDFVTECKNVSNLNIHETVQKSRKKAGPAVSFVAWKRLRKKPGQTRRTQVGRPVAVLDLEDFLQLLNRMA